MRTKINNMAELTIAGWSDGWRPIEAAPKDGTPILGCVLSTDGTIGQVYVVWYRNGAWVFFDSGVTRYSVNPFLWVPMPTLPEIAKD